MTMLFSSVEDFASRLENSVHVAFVDLSNAFPTVDYDVLWRKLQSFGIGGRTFDWLRLLFRDIRYRSRHKECVADTLLSTLVIVLGDSGSPIIFLMYIADFVTPAERADILFSTTVVDHLEHANDIVLISSCAECSQVKLNAIAR